ncbi:hypothetical protein F183_A35430 [Bryobacterales bacterium F-183]|nr:hypothetical protein F183_A35430 [Bryobacterales bacterium F-183]
MLINDVFVPLVNAASVITENDPPLNPAETDFGFTGKLNDSVKDALGSVIDEDATAEGNVPTMV